MSEIIDMFKSPEFYAAVVAFAAALRGLGELFIAIGRTGKLKEKEDWFDSTGAFLRNAADRLGKILTWLGIGNKQTKANQADKSK